MGMYGDMWWRYGAEMGFGAHCHPAALEVRRFISNPAEFTYQLYKLILKIKESKGKIL